MEKPKGEIIKPPVNRDKLFSLSLLFDVTETVDKLTY